MSADPREAAEMHVDKHVVKMIVESAQLLSTAHRLIDGIETTTVTDKGRRKRVWHLPDHRQSVLYSATHVNHPSAIWTMRSIENYLWLYSLMQELCKEYTHRYGKVHKCEREMIFKQLSYPPAGISTAPFTEPTPAMPDEYKVPGNSVQSYRNYYMGAKQRMFSWKHRNKPAWLV